jgi:hypothetical protein
MDNAAGMASALEIDAYSVSDSPPVPRQESNTSGLLPAHV